MILNRIQECSDGRERLMDLERRVISVVHRTETGHDAVEIAREYIHNEAAGRFTGHQMPYTFVIGRDGTIEQALKLSDYGPHAKAWNSKGVGIGCVGDFRNHRMPSAQYSSLVKLLAALSSWMNGPQSVYGHDELRDSMADARKECPGGYMNMNELRDDVKLELTGKLTGMGIIL